MASAAAGGRRFLTPKAVAAIDFTLFVTHF